MRLLLLSVLPLILSACVGNADMQVERYQFDDIRDLDGDGVIDARDICNETPAGVQVDADGCTHWDVVEHIQPIDFEFGFDKYNITDLMQRQLNNVASTLNENSDYRVTVIGDTSPEGSLRYNKVLAAQRANAIADTLRQLGIDDERIDIHYFTEEIPIVSDFLDKRKHRVVALVHSPDYVHQPEWNIFTSENKLKSQGKR